MWRFQEEEEEVVEVLVVEGVATAVVVVALVEVVGTPAAPAADEPLPVHRWRRFIERSEVVVEAEEVKEEVGGPVQQQAPPLDDSIATASSSSPSFFSLPFSSKLVNTGARYTHPISTFDRFSSSFVLFLSVNATSFAIPTLFA